MTEGQVRSLIFDVVLVAALNAISAAIPFFRLPVVNTIFTFIVTKIAGALYDELSRYVTFTLIDIKTKEQKARYEQAVNELRTAKPEEIDHAKEKFKSSLRDLIGINR